MLLQNLLRPLPRHDLRQLSPLPLVLRQFVLGVRSSFAQDVKDIVKIEAITVGEDALVLDVWVDERGDVETGDVRDVDVEAWGGV